MPVLSGSKAVQLSMAQAEDNRKLYGFLQDCQDMMNWLEQVKILDKLRHLLAEKGINP